MIPRRRFLLADRRGAAASTQTLILVGALALAGMAGVKVLSGSLAKRTDCAGEQIGTLLPGSPCGGGNAGGGESGPILASVTEPLASPESSSVSEPPAARSTTIGGGRFALPRPQLAGFVLAADRADEPATRADTEPATAQDEVLDLLIDVLGVKDAIKCVTEEDIVACAITVANFTPLRVVRLASSLNKIRRAADRLRAARRIRETAEASRREPSRELQPFLPPNNGFLGATRRQFLQPGQRIDRFGGSGFSRFFSPPGTPAGSRALPPGSAGQPLRTFEVLKPLEVEAGTAAPALGQPGGGTQFLTPVRLETLIQRGFLREIFP